MPPIRRYLRITRYSVLEVRIYLEQPSLADSWLLSSRSPALPRIIQAVRPLVLPKLREENENAAKKRGAGGSVGSNNGKRKKKSTKDTVTKDDFEVSIFLTETSTNHAILTKNKSFGGGKERMMRSNSGKMGIGRYLDGGGAEGDPVLPREESDDEDGPNLMDVPEANPAREDGTSAQPQDLSSDDDEEDAFKPANAAAAAGKRKRGAMDEGPSADDDDDDDDDDDNNNNKKKLGMKTEYEGFAIYGRILCLIVKRKGVKARAEAPVNSSQMLEKWVGTQVDKDGGAGLDDDG